MRFSFHQRFAHAADDVVDAYADPAMYAALPDLPRIGRPEVVACERRTGAVHLELRYALRAELPAAARAVVDPDRLTWVQLTEIDLAERVARIDLRPEHYADRLRCSGAFTFRPDGDDACVREASGDLRVKAALVAGQVERAIVSGLEEYLGSEAPAVDAWISGLLDG